MNKKAKTAKIKQMPKKKVSNTKASVNPLNSAKGKQAIKKSAVGNASALIKMGKALQRKAMMAPNSEFSLQDNRARVNRKGEIAEKYGKSKLPKAMQAYGEASRTVSRAKSAASRAKKKSK